MEPLYQITVECTLCAFEFRTSRVRSSMKKSVRTDSDFCIHYKEGSENPEYYVVRVCPNCGYASTDNFSTMLSERARSIFQEKVSSSWTGKDYGGTRTWNDALQVYKLALLTAQLTGERARVVAGILHHIAWLYRHRSESDGEERFLQYALDEYIKVYEVEESEVNGPRLMFLIGELHRRLGQYNEAVKWFSRVIQDKRIMDAGMIRACREGWATTREDMLAAKLEWSEELESAGK